MSQMGQMGQMGQIFFQKIVSFIRPIRLIGPIRPMTFTPLAYASSHTAPTHTTQYPARASAGRRLYSNRVHRSVAEVCPDK